MCDTLVLHDSAGKPLIFGKNSDRDPEEPQALVHLPPREPGTTFIREGIGFSDEGFAMLLSKPSWMSGGEMGINSKGLAIGNEAVFSRFKPDENGVLGMDILRAALSACATAKEAVDYITSFVEKYPQGGNGAYKGKLVYNNSFLAADPEEAYIIETAGKRWAWRKAMVADAISNAYCIEDDYKRLDTQTRKEIAPVNERAACSDEADPGRKGQRNSWKKHVEDAKYLFFTKGEQRRSNSLGGLMRLAASGAGTGDASSVSGARAGNGSAVFAFTFPRGSAEARPVSQSHDESLRTSGVVPKERDDGVNGGGISAWRSDCMVYEQLVSLRVAVQAGDSEGRPIPFTMETVCWRDKGG
jgi:hypothetical protein